MEKQILIVDDDSYILLISKTMLKHEGYIVETAESGEEALSILEKKEDIFSCIILDLTMPGLSGEETFKKIRKNNSNIPVIISSGYLKEEIEEKFYTEEIAGFLKKPFLANKLLGIVKEVLEKTP